MQLSDQTVDVLANFLKVNPNFKQVPGKDMVTIAPTKNCLVKYTATETFDSEFRIYDLSTFLSVLRVFTDPEIEFYDKYLTISSGNGKNKIKYYYAKEAVMCVPDKMIDMPEHYVEFDLSRENLSKITKVSAGLYLNYMVVEENNLRIVDKNSSGKVEDESNEFTVDVDFNVTKKEDVKPAFELHYFSLLEGDYRVRVSAKGIGEFKHHDMDLTYWIAANVK